MQAELRWILERQGLRTGCTCSPGVLGSEMAFVAPGSKDPVGVGKESLVDCLCEPTCILPHLCNTLGQQLAVICLPPLRGRVPNNLTDAHDI